MVAVITGLLLSGKSTLQKELINRGYHPVLEYTTRPIRNGEKNHKDYHFVDEEVFDKMEAADEFAETLHVETIYGLWKYGARKEDLKDGYILVCGPRQIKQLLDSGVPCKFILLDIDEETAMARAAKRGDNLEELKRRFTRDAQEINKIIDKMDMVLKADADLSSNVRLADVLIQRGDRPGYVYPVENEIAITAQKMSQGERNMWLKGNEGLTPYLRMRDRGMPQNPVNQIAWLLLQGSGCGFCKVCRENPCDIADSEKCTTNIANYIRECVHEEDKKREEREDEQNKNKLDESDNQSE